MQNYVNTRFNRGDISKCEKKVMQPKSEKNVRAYGLPKTHKHYKQLPKFRSITDTTNIPYYDILKFLSYLPNSLKEINMLSKTPYPLRKRSVKHQNNCLIKNIVLFDLGQNIQEWTKTNL